MTAEQLVEQLLALPMPDDTVQLMTEESGAGELWLAVQTCLTDAVGEGFDIPLDLVRQVREIFPDLNEYVDAVIAARRYSV